MKLVKLSSKGQLVIPKAVRVQLGIQPNKFVLLEVEAVVVTADPEYHAVSKLLEILWLK